jgi:hypothetical protein
VAEPLSNCLCLDSSAAWPEIRKDTRRRRSPVKKTSVVVYGILGTGALLYGITALLFPSALLSEATQSVHLAHILREQGAAAIFVGLMSFWCILNYERRTIVHYFLTIFAFLLTAIHWFDYLEGHLPLMSPLYNTVPFAVLLFMAVSMRQNSSRQSN